MDMSQFECRIVNLIYNSPQYLFRNLSEGKCMVPGVMTFLYIANG
jgi:hypothetical protein